MPCDLAVLLVKHHALHVLPSAIAAAVCVAVSRGESVERLDYTAREFFLLSWWMWPVYQ